MTFYLSFVISTIGFAYFVYGKKAYSIDFMLTGAGLMIYPYFIKNSALVGIIAVTLLMLPIVKKRLWH